MSDKTAIEWTPSVGDVIDWNGMRIRVRGVRVASNGSVRIHGAVDDGSTVDIRWSKAGWQRALDRTISLFSRVEREATP